MSAALPHGPGPLADGSSVASRFREVGYTTDALQQVLSVAGTLSSRSSEVEVYRRRLARQPGELADLLALLAVGLPLPEERAASALGVAAFDELERSGVIRREDSDVTAAVRILPHGDLAIASDGWAPGQDDDPLHVTGINPPARLLSSMTVRRNVGKALDVGTGNGIQALLASSHVEHVVATDVNPRALAFARFNAALNGVTNIEFREGSLFDPVEGERFDLIVCNPPYVISPDAEYVYRDSGDQPGALCRTIVWRLPEHLADGGDATVLVSWPVRQGTVWSREVGSWLAPGADAWLVRLGTDDPLSHAAEWNSPLIESAPHRFAPAVDRWLDYYDSEGIVAIDFGAVVLKQTGGPARAVRNDVGRPGPHSVSDQALRVFSAVDGPTGHELLDRILVLPPGHVFQQQLVCEDGEWRLVDAGLGLNSGIEQDAGLDPVMVQVVLGLDGTRTGREAVGRALAASGMDESELAGLTKASAEMFSDLYRRGVLVLG